MRFEAALDLAEQTFQIQDMMQRLVRQHGIILMSRSPLVEVGFHEVDLSFYALVRGSRAASLYHRGIQLEAVNNEIRTPLGNQMGRQRNQELLPVVARRRPEADYSV